MTDLERVHVVVTAKRTAVEENDEGHDVVTELPKIQRLSYSLYVSNNSLTSAQVTRRSFRPPGKSPSSAAKSNEYFSGQASPVTAIYDGQHPPNPPFATVAPLVQKFHPIFNLLAQLFDDPSVQPTNEDLNLILEGQMTDLERVQVVTASRATVKENDEGHDVVTELPEIQRPSCSLYVSNISLTLVQVTRRWFRPTANRHPVQPSQTSIFPARLVQLKP